MNNEIFTIGHSTHSIELFIELLLSRDIDVVCDVRSKPYSRINPQFNREALKESLKHNDIKYVFLGKELGARTDDKNCYENGQVQYDCLAQTDLFKSGIQRVKDGARSYRLALMCAEKEPLECHRTILVARYLVADGVAVSHILSDGRVERHSETINRLIARLKLSGPDMFRTTENVVREAYDIQGKQIAYHEKEGSGETLAGAAE